MVEILGASDDGDPRRQAALAGYVAALSTPPVDPCAVVEAARTLLETQRGRARAAVAEPARRRPSRGEHSVQVTAAAPEAVGRSVVRIHHGVMEPLKAPAPRRSSSALIDAELLELEPSEVLRPRSIEPVEPDEP